MKDNLRIRVCDQANNNVCDMATSNSSLLAKFTFGQPGVGTIWVAETSNSITWTTPTGLQVLASGGPGFTLETERRLRWYAYLGLQWNFALWKPD